jgi:hypothetical protein
MLRIAAATSALLATSADKPCSISCLPPTLPLYLPFFTIAGVAGEDALRSSLETKFFEDSVEAHFQQQSKQQHSSSSERCTALQQHTGAVPAVGAGEGRRSSCGCDLLAGRQGDSSWQLAATLACCQPPSVHRVCQH